MRYYVSPPRDADLGHGYERWIRRPEEKGRLDGLLRAISEIRRRGGEPVISMVSWRGIMTKYVFLTAVPHILRRTEASPTREGES
jgi:RAT1-interacting protein